MKKLLSLALIAPLLLSLFACAAKPAAAVPNPALVLGEKYLLDLDYDQALLQFDEAIRVDPKNPRGYLGQADALLHLGRQADAAETLAAGAKELKRGNPDQARALEEARAAAETSPEQGYLGLAAAYETIGFRDVALALLKRVAAELPRVREIVVAYHALAERLGVKAETAPPPTTAEPTAEPTTPPTATQVPSTANLTTTKKTNTITGEIKLEKYLVSFTPMVVDSYSLQILEEAHVNEAVTGENWFKVSAKTVAKELGCDLTPTKKSLYGGHDEKFYQGDRVEVSDYEGRAGVAWTNPNISVYGLKIGDTLAQANAVAQKVFREDFVEFSVEGFPDNFYDMGCSFRVESYGFMSPTLGVTIRNGKVACIYVYQEYGGIVSLYFGI